MMNLSRINLDTRQIEENLSGFHKDMHSEVIRHNRQGPGKKRLRWLSATIWLREQVQEPDPPNGKYPDAQSIQQELYGEVRAIMSDYGNLCLGGLVLYLSLLAGWLLFQDIIAAQLTLWSFSSLAVGCLILYPVVMYSFWNRGEIHMFKAIKLIFGVIVALVALAGIYALSLLEKQSPFFDSLVLSPFNLTEFLILVNLAVFLSFVIHFRRLNLFDDLSMNYQAHLTAFSGLSSGLQDEVNDLMGVLDVIPLKTHTKRKLKTRILETYTESGLITESAVKDFIRMNCISMNWMYWSGSAVQWTVVILLVSKLIWAHDTGLMVSADYFRQQLTTGMVMGAILLSTGVFCPLNYRFRELLYQEASFSLKQAWLLTGQALLFVSLMLFSGLVPSRFVWGIPVNPAPHPWAFLTLLSLVLLLQFFKSETRFRTYADE